jgi:hypothetical protein
MCSKIAEWRNVLATLLELSNLARHKRLKPRLVVSQKKGLLAPTGGLSFADSGTHSLMFQPKPIFTKMGLLVPIIGLLRITSSVITNFGVQSHFKDFPWAGDAVICRFHFWFYSLTCNLNQWCRTLLLCRRTLGNTGYALMGYSLEQAPVEPITTYHKGIVHK